MNEPRLDTADQAAPREVLQDPMEPVAPPPDALAPFNAQRLQRQLQMDSMMRWFAVIAVALIVLVTGLMEDQIGLSALVAIVLIMLVVVGAITLGSRGVRDLAHVTGLIPVDLHEAEHALAEALSRWPLPQWVRLMLMHRWAVIRYQQHRHPESAAICAALLGPLQRVKKGPAAQVHHHLLLMLLESQLQMFDLSGAYATLLRCERVNFTQTERLQRLVLQTRYELMCGRVWDVVLGLERKVQLAELMPAAHSGAMHLMLAQACSAVGAEDTARWLRRRAEQVQTLLGRGGVIDLGLPDPVEEQLPTTD